MYNNNGMYRQDGQLYPWNHNNINPTGTVYYNQIRVNYKPDPCLPPYNGPYPVEELQKARSSLIESLLYDTSDIIQRIKPRMGIDSCYGRAHEVIPPVRAPESNKVSAAQGSSSSSSTSGTDTGSKNSNLMPIPSKVSSSSTSSAASSTLTSSSYTSKNLIQIGSSSSSLPTTPNNESLRRGGSSSSLKRKAVDDISDVKTKKNTSAISVDDKSLHVYKCDFCHFQCNTSAFVKHHLKEAKHFSASLYNTRNGQLVSVEKKLAVKNKQGKNEALVK